MNVHIITNSTEDPVKSAKLNTKHMRDISRGVSRTVFTNDCVFISALDELDGVSPEDILKMSNAKQHDIAVTSDWYERSMATHTNVVNGMLVKVKKLKMLSDKYSGKMDNMIAGSGSIISMLPKRTYYDALEDYDKKKIRTIMSEKVSLLPEQRNLLSRKEKLKKSISSAERDVKKISKSLSRAKSKIEDVIPGVAIRFESIKTIENRRLVPGYSDLTKGKQAIFGHRAREFVSSYETLDLARSKLDKLFSKQTEIEIDISNTKEKLDSYNAELERILPGSSLSTIEAIKSGKQKTVKIQEIFPEFTILPSKDQAEFLKLVRLRNTKSQEILDINDKTKLYHKKISDSKLSVTYEFRMDAVDFANDLYIASTNEQKPRPPSLIWTTAYFIYTSSHPCICLDSFEIYPDAFIRFVEALSKSPIDKTIYVSSIYTPEKIPHSVTIHTVE